MCVHVVRTLYVYIQELVSLETNGNVINLQHAFYYWPLQFDLTWMAAGVLWRVKHSVLKEFPFVASHGMLFLNG